MTVSWRALGPRELDHETLWLSVAAGGAVCAAAALTAPQFRLPTCAFKVLTGLPCPTCGFTRASLALARGELAVAVAWNPLLVALAAGSLLYLIYAALVLAGRAPRCRVRLSRVEAHALRAVAVATVAANWIYLVVSGR